MLYDPKQVIQEVDNFLTGDLDRMISGIHHTPDDFEDGDLEERINEFRYYHMVCFNLNDLNADEFMIDDFLVNDYVEKINNEGIESMPPILIDNKGSIIDGTHRLNALLATGFEQSNLYVGSHESLDVLLKHKNTPSFKKQHKSRMR